MKPFAKLFELPEFGQVLAVLDRGDEAKPSLTWSTQPPDLGVCSIVLGFADSDSGWDAAEKAFNQIDEQAATSAAIAIWNAIGGTTP